MLTPAQISIIRDVCSIQFLSLEDILVKVDLGNDPENEPYENILLEMGCTRRDFDQELMQTYQSFKRVHEDPELLFELCDLDLLVFKHILHKWEPKWANTYPKALVNLWNKLFLFSAINELQYATTKN